MSHSNQQGLGHSTPGGPGSHSPLPEGFRRAEGVPAHRTIEGTRVLRIGLRVHGGGVYVAEIEAGKRPTIRPAPRERLRDLRAGDRVEFVANGSHATVAWVELAG